MAPHGGPDITASAPPALDLAEEERLRAEAYGLLAGLLARPPGAEVLAGLAAIGDAGAGNAAAASATPLAAAFTALGRRAAVADPAAVRAEFDALFIGLSGGELSPYASYYRTGFLNEKPLAEVRAAMARLGIARAADVHEPEDHIAALCEMMAGLIAGAFGGPVPLDQQRRFFDDHIAPWAGRFFADLERAGAADFYAGVGAVGRCFLDIETQAFALLD